MKGDQFTTTAGSQFSLDNLKQQLIHSELDTKGYAVVKGFLKPESCEELKSAYTDSDIYRSTIRMARYSFGKGEYKYYKYPLPNVVSSGRSGLYEVLAPIANQWHERLKVERKFPNTHAEYLELCEFKGQTRPTPLILKYGAGDFNCLHQDLYGDEVFPIQVAIMLDQAGTDFDGGEFILSEQRPRMQSKASVVPMNKGDLVIFPVNERPIAGKRGDYRVKMRHGVSEVQSGNRHVLGIIFHDAA